MRGACNATKQSLTSLDEIATPTSRLVMTNSTRHYEEQSDEVADFRTDGVEDEVRANPDSEQKERTCGEATKSDSLRAWRKSKTIPNALNTRHSETPKAGSESVTRASNKKTLNQVQGDTGTFSLAPCGGCKGNHRAERDVCDPACGGEAAEEGWGEGAYKNAPLL